MPLFEGLEEFQNVSPVLQWAIFIVMCLIAIVALGAGGVACWLAVKYIKYNRTMNKKGITGSEAARMILDNNGLQNIKVSTFGSLLFGNSYSHYFKKVRIRRISNKKPSVTSLAIGAEKASLAVLDKEGDPDMRTRVALTPLMYFGPLAFIPIIIIGVVIDILIFGFNGTASFVAAVLGLGLYVFSVILSIKTLKTEKKAQARACEILKEEGLATAEEIEMMKELFKLYNIQYINDIILQFLQLLLKVLETIAKLQSKSNSNA